MRIAKLVRLLDPLPAVPARIEPLGPEPGIASPRNPTWSEFAASFSPVRELVPGARPRDWVGDAERRGDVHDTRDDAHEARAGAGHAGACGAGESDTRARDGATGNVPTGETSARDRATGDTSAGDGAVGAARAAGAAAGGAVGALEAPQRYKVQFTASQEYVDLLERARDLLAHAVPGRSIEQVHLRALRVLVAELEKKKYAATDRTDTPERVSRAPQSESAVPRRRGKNLLADNPAHPRQRDDAASTPKPRRRGAIPAAVRRAVRERDADRCAYVDASEQRCRERALLEFHHRLPFAHGGPATLENLELRCRAHNALAAEQDFGRGLMERHKGRAAAGP